MPSIRTILVRINWFVITFLLITGASGSYGYFVYIYDNGNSSSEDAIVRDEIVEEEDLSRTSRLISYHSKSTAAYESYALYLPDGFVGSRIACTGPEEAAKSVY